MSSKSRLATTVTEPVFVEGALFFKKGFVCFSVIIRKIKHKPPNTRKHQIRAVHLKRATKWHTLENTKS